jgi:hypothetical protein
MNTQEFLEFFKRKYFCCFLFLLEKINILFRLSGCFKFWYFIHVNVIVYIFSEVFVKFEINPFIPSTLNYERSWMLTFFPWNRTREIIVILLSNKEWWVLWNTLNSWLNQSSNLNNWMSQKLILTRLDPK